MPVYRYQYTMFNATRLAMQVPGVIVEGSAGPSVYKDITANTSSKDDLDNYMAEQGFTYISTDPATTPAQQGSASIAIASSTVPGTVIISDTAPANVTKATAGPGTSTETARRDHKHDITTGTASANPPGTSNAEGSASSLARSDHTHQLASFGSTTGTFCQGDDSRLSNARTPTGAAGGDLSGNYANPTVAQSSIAFALNGVISPASIGASQNDYNPTGLATASTLRLTSGAAYNITGLVGGAAGRLILVHNIGANNLTLTNEDAGSTAANRFALRGAASLVVTPNKAVVLQYDATTARWRALGADDPYGTAVNTVCQGNDSRLSDARTPSGTAGGDLSGNYANPTVKQSTVAFALNGVISPTSIGANQNDYNPTGLSTANTLRLTSSAAYNITGLAGGTAGRLVTIHNIGSFNLTLTNESASSTAANRFVLRSASDLILTPNKAMILQYDAITARWRFLGTDDPVPSMTYTVAEANSNITTTSATPVLATGMTLTPVAGTYLCFFSGNSYNDTTGAGLYVEVSIYANSSQVTASVQRMSDSVNFNQTFCCVAVVTVNGSQDIEGRWMRTAGTGTAYMQGRRSLQIIKIG